MNLERFVSYHRTWKNTYPYLWGDSSFSTRSSSPPKNLDILSNTLEDDEFKYLIETCTISHFDLIRCKGVYPYDYMDSVERFDKEELPSQEAFYNKLSGDSFLKSSAELVLTFIN